MYYGEEMEMSVEYLEKIFNTALWTYIYIIAFGENAQ